MNWDKLKLNIAIAFDVIGALFSVFMICMLVWVMYNNWQTFVLGIGMVFMVCMFSLNLYWGMGRLT